ncbi:MAG TPA: hypothetical protein VFI39_03355 [Gemmatimonadales bacterium]|nr:hypothetical protein [Gemmatimonadales bacterium]
MLLCVASVALISRNVSAQADPRAIKLRDDCRLAEQVLRTGDPAPKRAWAIGIIGACPQGGQVMADGLLALRQSQDTVALEGLLDEVQGYQSPELWSAALQVATDAGSSPLARAYSFHILIDDLGMSLVVTNHELLDTPVGGTCIFGRVHGLPALSGPALPGDYVQRTLTGAQGVVADSTAPGSVRSAAECAQLYAGLKLGLH